MRTSKQHYKYLDDIEKKHLAKINLLIEQSRTKYKNKIIENVKKRLPFNVLGLLYCNFNIDKPRKDHYFCSEFVATALKQADIDIKKKPNLYHPADFLEIDGIKCLYQGKIKDAINRSFDE